MTKKLIAVMLMAVFMIAASGAASAAENLDQSLTHGAASLAAPGWGQYLNSEMETKGGKFKTGTMVVLEIGGIVTTVLLGTLVGAPVVWAGIGILVFNHLWSATDAYMKAPVGPEVAMTGVNLER